MNRNKIIGFKVTSYENMAIRSKAKQSSLSLSKYLRMAALNKQINVVHGLDKLIPELNRIGNNINQTTAILRARENYNPDFHVIKEDFSKLLDWATNTLNQGQQDGNHQINQY